MFAHSPIVFMFQFWSVQFELRNEVKLFINSYLFVMLYNKLIHVSKLNKERNLVLEFH